MITIVDYGMGNLRSVQKAFEALGHAAVISSDPRAVADASHVVLPGVGAFPDAVQRLRDTGLGDAVVNHIDAGRPFLGICLGMQLLFARGHEGGSHDGLGVFSGDVVPFPPDHPEKVPHMGWNTLTLTRPDCPLFRDLPPAPAFYFVHAYHAIADVEVVAATADYPTPITAVVWKENVFATQFHPEKSQAVGLTLLANFAAL